MVTVAKKLSQVITHMGIAFSLTYYLTGSLAFGGLAAIIEPIINVMLLPLHEKSWERIRHHYVHVMKYILITAEKISQTAMHMMVAFAVIYGATGSLAFGGIVAILEPVFNVVILPFHDKGWEIIKEKLIARKALPQSVNAYSM